MSDANTVSAQDGKDGTILVVDDDEEEIFILRRALALSPIHLDLDIAKNGQEALESLTKRYESGTLSDISLILLDLNMPQMDGHVFLKTIRSDERFSTLPVVVLTTSNEPSIIKQAQLDGANAVVTKTDSMEEMMKIVDTIVQFWFRTAQKFYID